MIAGGVTDDFGTFMNFEPSLFVYLAVGLGIGEVEACKGAWDLGWRGFAGIGDNLEELGPAYKSERHKYALLRVKK